MSVVDCTDLNWHSKQLTPAWTFGIRTFVDLLVTIGYSILLYPKLVAIPSFYSILANTGKEVFSGHLLEHKAFRLPYSTCLITSSSAVSVV